MGQCDDGPDGAALVEWLRWLNDRPRAVRQVASQLPPWRRYKIRVTWQVVEIESYGELRAPFGPMKTGDVSLTVVVVHDPRGFAPVRVFGLAPGDLEAA